MKYPPGLTPQPPRGGGDAASLAPVYIIKL
jgi:hypothetical protein